MIALFARPMFRDAIHYSLTYLGLLPAYFALFFAFFFDLAPQFSRTSTRPSCGSNFATNDAYQ